MYMSYLARKPHFLSPEPMLSWNVLNLLASIVFRLNVQNHYLNPHPD